MTIDDVRKPEGALERSPKAGESAPSGVDANRRPKRCWVAGRQRGRIGTRVSACAATSPAYTLLRFV